MRRDADRPAEPHRLPSVRARPPHLDGAERFHPRSAGAAPRAAADDSKQARRIELTPTALLCGDRTRKEKDNNNNASTARLLGCGHEETSFATPPPPPQTPFPFTSSYFLGRRKAATPRLLMDGLNECGLKYRLSICGRASSPPPPSPPLLSLSPTRPPSHHKAASLPPPRPPRLTTVSRTGVGGGVRGNHSFLANELTFRSEHNGATSP